MEDVVISEAIPSTSSSFSDARIICRVCQKQFAQYTCPRCNSRYCSLQCYKGHSLRCTESFMRENVMEELQQIQTKDETKSKMLDILKRFHAEEEMNSDDEDESMLSEETVQRVLSGNEIGLEDLSADEIKHFRKALASGELSRLIEPWTPWWTKPSARSISLSPQGSQLVKPLNEHDETVAQLSTTLESNLSEFPAGPENPLPPLRQLTSTDPSPFLVVHLVDVLFSYCFTLRLYNGDWHSDPFGAATAVLSVSKVLGDDARPETVAEALGACLEQACSPVYRHTGGFRFRVGLLDDVISLLRLGCSALISSLCDLQRLIQAGERMLKSEKMGKAEKKSKSSRKLHAAERKVYFLMCWVHDQPGEAWSSLAGIVEVEKASLSESGHSVKPVKAERKAAHQTKALVEEI